MMISFKGNHFKKTIVLMAVRWYLAYSLSYRDIEELMAERGISVDHSTIHRWVIKYAPKLEAIFTKKYKKTVGQSWCMDETYIKVKGRWCYLYRAIDKSGNTIDFMLSACRDELAAKSFFDKVLACNERSVSITCDKNPATNTALRTINENETMNHFIKVRNVKYLNNIIEQDYRFIKRIVRPMLGFKDFLCAEATLIGIELHHMLRKNQHVMAGDFPVYKQFYDLAK